MSEEQRPPEPEEDPVEKKVRAGAWMMTGTVFAWNVGRRAAGALWRWLARPPESESAATRLARLAHAAGELAAQPRQEREQESGRAADRNLTLSEEKYLLTRRRGGTFLVGIVYLAAICGGIGFVVAYWTGGSNQAIGGSLAVFLAGMGAVLVLWAHALTAHKEAVDPREDMTPPLEEREKAEEDFCKGRRELQRRGLLKGMVGGALAVMAAMGVSLFRSLGFNPNNTLYSTVWKPGQRLMTADGQPVKADSLKPGNTTIVFPENSIGSERSQTVLIRVNEQLLELPSDRSDWAPMGNLAFSRVCTHAGCAVGMYEKTAHLLMCPCHQSTFNVLRAAEPTGGPAARPLPQLPLYVDGDGVLRAGGGFSNPPGPGFWGMPS